MAVMLFLLTVFIVITVVFLIPRWRLSQVTKKPFPCEWERILKTNIPIYSHLPSNLKQQLKQRIKLFLFKKRFYGCNGLIITDEIRVTIAAEACFLIINRPTSLYNSLHYILVYPSAFRKTSELITEGGVESKENVDLLGESWDRGKVILSWDDVEKDAKNMASGHNVALHEFAHQLDFEGGSANGAPLLRGRGSYQRWAEVLSSEYASLCQRNSSGLKDVMDNYGSCNPAEFFAVATEAFFEKPHTLQQQHPELYDELQEYYCVDPREWFSQQTVNQTI